MVGSSLSGYNLQSHRLQFKCNCWLCLCLTNNTGLNLEAKSQKPLQFDAIYFFGDQKGTSKGQKYTSQTLYFFGDFFHIHPCVIIKSFRLSSSSLQDVFIYQIYITWRILARAPGYNPVTGMCQLCLKESFFYIVPPRNC